MRRPLILLVLATISCVPLTAQNDQYPTFEDTLAVYRDLFGIQEPLNLTLKFDIKQYQKSRNKDEYLPAELTCQVNDTFRVTHSVRVKARGIFRRGYCSLPPIWLNIKHAGIETEELADVKKLKLVTYCRSGTSFENYILREYLCYKIYNVLSTYSFNVRLAWIKYIDTGRKDKESEGWGFIIEPEEMMAKRNNCVSIKNDRLSLATVNQEWMDKVAFFSYMIGQGDYSVTGRHNLKILTSLEYGTGGYIPVPYDFDYSGLVNTTYATPQEDLGLSSVTERYYLGACRTEEENEKTILWLASYREQIEDLIRSFEYLEEKERQEMIDYIESYFEETEQKNFIARNITSTCR